MLRQTIIDNSTYILWWWWWYIFEDCKVFVCEVNAKTCKKQKTKENVLCFIPLCIYTPFPLLSVCIYTPLSLFMSLNMCHLYTSASRIASVWKPGASEFIHTPSLSYSMHVSFSNFFLLFPNHSQGGEVWNKKKETKKEEIHTHQRNNKKREVVFLF